MAHAQKFPPICCTTQATSSTSTYVHPLGSQSRQASQQSVVPTTSSLSIGTDPATACARACLPWQETTQKSTAEWCSWVQRQMQRSMSLGCNEWSSEPCLFCYREQLEWHSPNRQTPPSWIHYTESDIALLPSPPLLAPGRTPRFTYCFSGVSLLLVLSCCLALLVRWVGPFLPRLGPTIGSPCLVCPSFHLFTWVFMTTGASVHRRGRCIGVFFSQVYVVSLVLSVLVRLSVDVTGALVLI